MTSNAHDTLDMCDSHGTRAWRVANALDTQRRNTLDTLDTLDTHDMALMACKDKPTRHDTTHMRPIVQRARHDSTRHDTCI